MDYEYVSYKWIGVKPSARVQKTDQENTLKKEHSPSHSIYQILIDPQV